jgi:hypothetical protein
MKRYIKSDSSDSMETIKYSRRNSTYRVGDYSISIWRSYGQWHVSVLNRATLEMSSKIYRDKNAINNFTEKFEIHVEF